jgi:hypothetical protein
MERNPTTNEAETDVCFTLGCNNAPSVDLFFIRERFCDECINDPWISTDEFDPEEYYNSMRYDAIADSWDDGDDEDRRC